MLDIAPDMSMKALFTLGQDMKYSICYVLLYVLSKDGAMEAEYEVNFG